MFIDKMMVTWYLVELVWDELARLITLKNLPLRTNSYCFHLKKNRENSNKILYNLT